LNTSKIGIEDDKKIISIFSLIIFTGCSDNPVVPSIENNNVFAIFFLKDTTLTIEDIFNTNLADLVLADKPWITQDDIADAHKNKIQRQSI
jgi:hypothetical protein